MRRLVLLVVLAACGSEVPTAVSSTPDTPSCTEVEAFADALVDVGITYDYEAMPTPAALTARADAVFTGTLTGGFTHTAGDMERGVSPYVAYEVDVDRVIKGEPADPTFVGVAYDPAHEEPARYEAAAVEGIPVVVFAFRADDVPGGLSSSLEGFATACEGGAPMGRVGDWDAATLGQLADAAAAEPPPGTAEVALWHCGIEPITYEGRTWEVPDGEEPFDGTNAPASFAGRGEVERVGPDELRYTDESGMELRFVPDDGVERPCA